MVLAGRGALAGRLFMVLVPCHRFRRSRGQLNFTVAWTGNLARPQQLWDQEKSGGNASGAAIEHNREYNESVDVRKLPQVPVHEVDQFIVHRFGLFRSSLDGRGRTMFQVVPHELSPHTTQRLLHGRDLRQDVGAVAILVDHFLQSTHLPFDASESLEIAIANVGIDADSFSVA